MFFKKIIFAKNTSFFADLADFLEHLFYSRFHVNFTICRVYENYDCIVFYIIIEMTVISTICISMELL